MGLKDINLQGDKEFNQASERKHSFAVAISDTTRAAFIKQFNRWQEKPENIKKKKGDFFEHLLKIQREKGE